MGRPTNGGGRGNASMTMANVTAYGGGILSATMFLGPCFEAAHAPFIDYCTNYYGDWTVLPATIFLFCLMAVMITGLTTIIIHTLIEVIRANAHFFGSLLKFGKKGHYYD